MKDVTLSILRCGKTEDPAVSAETLARLEERCFSTPWSENSYRYLLSSEYHRLFLLQKAGEIVGWAVLYIIFEEGELQNIAVIPEERGQGYATELLVAVMHRAKEEGAEALHLEVREGNLPARKLYCKQGFTEVGRRKNYYRNPTEDAVLMTRDITKPD